jgi:hypothetical protein
MRFSAIHKLTSYLMVLSAVGALLLSPEVSLLSTALALGGIALSWLAEPSRLPLERFTAYWNVATVIFFFYLVTEIYRGEAVITAGANFLLFVLVNKLFNRRSSKDYLQAYVVSFLLLVVATTLNTNISYAVCFCCYALFAVWTLSLFHLRREMEENYLLKHSDDAQSEKVEVERILNSRRIVGGPFLAGTSLISVGVVAGAALVFTLFPRIGFGLFVAHKRGGVAIAGFRDRVELGHHGVVRDNPAVVMRVQLGDGGGRGDGPPPPMRWRGTAFDRYEGGAWSHSPGVKGAQSLSPRDGLYVINRAPGLDHGLSSPELRARLTRQEIYLEPLDSQVLFAADRPVAISELTRGPGAVGRLAFRPRRGPLGEIHTSRVRSAGLHYVAYSQLTAPAPELLRRSPPIASPRLEHFLQLPPSLPPRIAELARRITRDERGVYDRVMAIQRYLRTNLRYTLRLTHDARLEPVDEFLFVTRQGHCEYFASAMTLMLRAIGIHARNVNGFAGGEWNGFGKYLAVRHGDAHAWVEVLFAGVGWVTFDPTPPAAGASAAARTGIAGKLRQLLDTLRMRWFRHVVEYDLRQQVSALRDVQRWFSPPRGASGLGRGWPLAAAALATAAAVFLALRRRRLGRSRAPRGRAPRGSLPGSAQLYARFLALCARRGHRKSPAETPREFALALARTDFGPRELAARFTDCYYRERFGGAAIRGGLGGRPPPAPGGDGQELQQLLAELGRELARPQA